MYLFKGAHASHLSVPPELDVGRRQARLIVVLEGFFDVEFSTRISTILHRQEAQVPDLRALEQSGEIILVPIGGSNFLHWTHRLAGLGLCEFHLLDREIAPLTEERERAAELINQPAGCRAVLTGKRALENYLSPQALNEVRGIDVPFGDQDDVALLAASCLLKQTGGPDWSVLKSRTRRRLRNLAKQWLNTEAVDRMTVARLAERDPIGEVRSWLMTIGRLGTAE